MKQVDQRFFEGGRKETHVYGSFMLFRNFLFHVVIDLLFFNYPEVLFLHFLSSLEPNWRLLLLHLHF